jgi:L-fucose isomerase-like protein
MKAQLIILCLLVSTISTEAFAKEKEAKKVEKKTQKSKYDFNIFKLYTITKGSEQPDSLNIEVMIEPDLRKKD